MKGKKRIVVVPTPNTFLLDIAGPVDVFTAANQYLAPDEQYEVILASPTAQHDVAMKAPGVAVTCPLTVFELQGRIDTLLIAGFNVAALKNHEELVGWIKEIYPRVRRIGSVCVGTFALAAAGLLDGRHATTHWEQSQRLQETYPQIKVDANPLFTIDGNIYTSAGVSSGIDLALALLEEDHGRDVAVSVARRLVLYLKRPGGQEQFSSLLHLYGTEASLAGRLRPWLLRNLDRHLSIDLLASQVNMSVRNFTRVFMRETGITPAKFIERLRVDIARKYLEESDMSIESIGEKAGLGGQVSMRRTFLRHMLVSPADYRRTFRTSLSGKMHYESLQ
jgi:transcriptional regulator GlxA family with amidase domain